MRRVRGALTRRSTRIDAVVLWPRLSRAHRREERGGENHARLGRGVRTGMTDVAAMREVARSAALRRGRCARRVLSRHQRRRRQRLQSCDRRSLRLTRAVAQRAGQGVREVGLDPSPTRTRMRKRLRRECGRLGSSTTVSRWQMDGESRDCVLHMSPQRSPRSLRSVSSQSTDRNTEGGHALLGDVCVRVDSVTSSETGTRATVSVGARPVYRGRGVAGGGSSGRVTPSTPVRRFRPPCSKARVWLAAIATRLGVGGDVTTPGRDLHMWGAPAAVPLTGAYIVAAHP